MGKSEGKTILWGSCRDIHGVIHRFSTSHVNRRKGDARKSTS